MLRSPRRMRSNSLRSSVAAAVEWLEGRVLLSTYTVTNLNDSGPGSYSDAIGLASNNPGFDTIRFAPGLSGTVNGGGVITDDLSILGPGAGALTMNGDFVINNGAAFDVSGLTIHGGSSAMAAISFNFASPGPTCGITDCTITGGHQFGIYAGNGNLVVMGCTVSGSQGYGIYNDGAGVTVIDSTVSENGGAGIGGNQALLDVRNSTIANNTGPGIDSSGQGLALTNSTVANNRGGGIFAGQSQGVTVTNSTIVGNSGANEAGIAADGTTRINNSIVAANRNANGDASDLGAPGPFSVTTGSNNLIGTGGSGGLVNGQNGNRVGIADPKLAPLGDYGGPTETMPPLAGSPAIDGGNNALAVGPHGHALLDDQRGNVRIANATVDIGAVEFDSTPLVLNGTVTNLNDSGPGSLRDAIEEANIHPGADTITFGPGLSGTITLTTGALTITDDVSIVGPGANVLAVSGNHASGAFDVEDPAEGTINISGITVKDSGGPSSPHPAVGNEIPSDLVLTDCVLSGNSGFVVAWGDGSTSITRCTISGNTGGIVVNASRLIVSGSTISGNAGGILAPQIEMSNTVISDNTGAAIGVGGFPADSTITDCTINGNDGDGVDFNAAATMTVTNCTIANNSGIGIWERANKVTVTGSTVSGNAAGILAHGPTVVVNSTIANNKPTNANHEGGGILSDSVLTVVNSTISGNIASQGAGIWLTSFGESGPSSARIDNTIVAANQDLNGRASDLSVSTDAPPPATFTGSNNLIGTGGSGGLVNGQNGNIVGVDDPMLWPLGNYGGPTQTMPPMGSSFAVDHGSNALAVGPDGQPLTTDQRGYSRIINGTVDIGAVEFGVAPANQVVTNLNASGPGSLSEAVIDANINRGPDTITFAPGLTGTIPSDVTVTDDVTTITGPGASVLTINGGILLSGYGGAFHSPIVNISGLTIKGTVSSDAINTQITLTDCTVGGVDTSGGAVIRRCTTSGLVARAFGNFDVSDSTIRGAVDFPVGSTGFGSFTNCTITGSSGDGIHSYDEGTTITLTRCTVSGNAGSGIHTESGFVNVIDSTVSGNGGFGIAGTDQPTLLVSGSTIANNREGGITYHGAMAAVLRLVNSTVANNMGTGVTAGGFLAVTNSTIVGNVGTTVGGIDVGYTTHINNTIVAGNRNASGASDVSNPGPQITFTGSNNLIGTGGSDGLVNGQNGNIVGVADPKLAPLGDYGGPTQTMPPLAGSPAIDAGNNALAVDENGKPLISDQRGDYRIVNGRVDIGSVEFNSTPIMAGDANGDGKVDFADMLILAQNYGTTTGAAWTQGDFTGDGAVNFDDLLLLARNFGRTRLRR